MESCLRSVSVPLGGSVGWWVVWWSLSMETSWVAFPADPPLLIYKVALMVLRATLSEGAGVSSHIVPGAATFLDLFSGRFDDPATVPLREVSCPAVPWGVAFVWRAVSAPLVLALLVVGVVLLPDDRIDLAHSQQCRVSVLEGHQAFGLLLAFLDRHGFLASLVPLVPLS